MIAAGSTGSIPATARLLKALAGLPRGVVVLPGLDTSLAPSAHAALLDENGAPHGHPQYGLGKLLRDLGTTPQAVAELAPEPRAARTLVVRQALALAEATAGWAAARTALDPQVAEAAQGLAVLAAATADEEARAIGLAARDALARGRTVGIISPDQNLTRRISAELRRFGIEVDDPAGTPLFQSPAGRLARLILAVAVNGFGAVDVMALLRNRSATFGLVRADVARLADRIELCLLRGQRLRPGIAGLRLALAQNAEAQRGPRLGPADREAAADLLDRLEAALEPLTLLIGGGVLNAPTFARALHGAFAEVTAAANGEPAPPGALELVGLGRRALRRPAPCRPQLPAGRPRRRAVPADAGFEVRNPERRRDDIAIWGQLEARLQHRDLMILAGLNEDIWPQPADPGPWLSRGMRVAAGLEPPERRQGQAAHDFEMALGNPEVLIAFCRAAGHLAGPALAAAAAARCLPRRRRRQGAAPARRRLARSGAGPRCEREQPRGADRPLPRPPAQVRPRKLSVTEIETLFRSPYDLYARHTLRLRKLGAAGRGARPARARHDDPPGLRPLRRARARFRRCPMRNASWRRWRPTPSPGSTPSASAATSGSGASRSPPAASSNSSGRVRPMSPPATPKSAASGRSPRSTAFASTARADRVDRLADGSYDIIDFKTGGVPSPGEMKAFEAPQLLLEAAHGAAGGFEDLPPGAGERADLHQDRPRPRGLPDHALQPPPRASTLTVQPRDRQPAAAARRRVPAVRSTCRCRRASCRVVGQRYRGDYDHLARTDEWTLLEGDDSE